MHGKSTGGVARQGHPGNPGWSLANHRKGPRSRRAGMGWNSSGKCRFTGHSPVTKGRSTGERANALSCGSSNTPLCEAASVAPVVVRQDDMPGVRNPGRRGRSACPCRVCREGSRSFFGTSARKCLEGCLWSRMARVKVRGGDGSGVSGRSGGAVARDGILARRTPAMAGVNTGFKGAGRGGVGGRSQAPATGTCPRVRSGRGSKTRPIGPRSGLKNRAGSDFQGGPRRAARRGRDVFRHVRCLRLRLLHWRQAGQLPEEHRQQLDRVQDRCACDGNVWTDNEDCHAEQRADPGPQLPRGQARDDSDSQHDRIVGNN